MYQNKEVIKHVQVTTGTVKSWMGLLVTVDTSSINLRISSVNPLVLRANSAHLLQEGYLSIKMPDSRKVLRVTQSCQLGKVKYLQWSSSVPAYGVNLSSLRESTKQWMAL